MVIFHLEPAHSARPLLATRQFQTPLRVFSMDSDESLNPYAPPKAQPVSPEASGGDVFRRPRSVKWATFVFTFFFVIQVVLYWRTISAVGVRKVWEGQSLFDPMFFLPLGFVFSWLGGRRKIAYYVNAFLLAMVVIKIVWSAFVLQRHTPHAFSNVLLPQRMMVVVMTSLFGYLFYRYTFGLPSRRYFGVAREEPAVPSIEH